MSQFCGKCRPTRGNKTDDVLREERREAQQSATLAGLTGNALKMAKANLDAEAKWKANQAADPFAGLTGQARAAAKLEAKWQVKRAARKHQDPQTAMAAAFAGVTPTR
jgi:hypothetical protein